MRLLFIQKLTTLMKKDEKDRMEAQYKYYTDDRKKDEVQLTNRLVHSLSELNFHLLHAPIAPSPLQQKPIKKEDILYVCLRGLPPFEDEFKSLQLPGECLNFSFPSFDKSLSEEQLLSLETEFDALAKDLHKRINKASTSKPIIIVHHSFGTYVFASYCQMFKTQRIIGIIDIGGVPIRFYPVLRSFISNIKDVSIDFVKENLEILHQTSNQRNKDFNISIYEKKQQTLGVFRAFKSQPGFREMFEYSRNLPKVLKCFIFGRKDSIFPEDMSNEKVAYYSYRNKFQPQYDTQLKETYQRCFGGKCQNVQERFIFSIEAGYHSVHMQKKYREVNMKIVKRYLDFIEEVYATKQAKL